MKIDTFLWYRTGGTKPQCVFRACRPQAKACSTRHRTKKLKNLPQATFLTFFALLGFKSLLFNAQKKTPENGCLFLCLSKTKLYIYVAKSEEKYTVYAFHRLFANGVLSSLKYRINICALNYITNASFLLQFYKRQSALP